MISIQKERPPFVRWEETEVGLDPVLSKEAGRPVPKVVVMALITPHGSKDVVEKQAVEWLEQINKKALNGEYPVEWVNFFRHSFEEWKKGNELPREGTPIRTWAMIGPGKSTANRLIAAGITTVEDLAAFPDSNLGVIGLDGRHLRDMAKGWVDEAKDKGINAKAIADANVKISQQAETIESLKEAVADLKSRLDADDKPRRGKAAA
jgi:hypothetical protein